MRTRWYGAYQPAKLVYVSKVTGERSKMKRLATVLASVPLTVGPLPDKDSSLGTHGQEFVDPLLSGLRNLDNSRWSLTPNNVVSTAQSLHRSYHEEQPPAAEAAAAPRRGKRKVAAVVLDK